MRATGQTARFLVAAATVTALSAPGFAQVKDYRQIQFPKVGTMTIPKPQRIVLDNGMVLMLLENHELPLIEVSARIRTGSRLDPAEKTGLAGMFGQVLRTGGTKTMTGDQIDDFLEARAAMIDTGVGTDSGTAGLSCLAQDFDSVLKVFSDVLRNPEFSDDKIKLVKNQANSGISRRNDNPQGVMNREFAKLVYGETSPYARTTEYATIEAVSRDDFAAFHAKYYQPHDPGRRRRLRLEGDDPQDQGRVRGLEEGPVREGRRRLVADRGPPGHLLRAEGRHDAVRHHHRPPRHPS